MKHIRPVRSFKVFAALVAGVAVLLMLVMPAVYGQMMQGMARIAPGIRAQATVVIDFSRA